MRDRGQLPSTSELPDGSPSGRLGIGSWEATTAACVIAAALLAACGKKGPPLPPLVRVPDVVRDVAARRVGGDVFVKLTLPVGNVDASTPVNLGRVEVYGYTGQSAPPP